MPIKSFKGPIKAFVCFCANPIFCNFSQKRFYNLELWYNNDQGYFQDNSRSTKFNNFLEQRYVKASKRWKLWSTMFSARAALWSFEKFWQESWLSHLVDKISLPETKTNYSIIWRPGVGLSKLHSCAFLEKFFFLRSTEEASCFPPSSTGFESQLWRYFFSLLLS